MPCEDVVLVQRVGVLPLCEVRVSLSFIMPYIGRMLMCPFAANGDCTLMVCAWNILTISLSTARRGRGVPAPRGIRR